jgi:hypothetical protein
MKAATISMLKKELQHCSEEELRNLCMRMAKYKVENKELLTYLMFDSQQEDNYINEVKLLIDKNFGLINDKSYYLLRKGVRKILRETKKYIRYSGEKRTSVELLCYFCERLKAKFPNMTALGAIQKILDTTLNTIRKQITYLHEDLQYDYKKIISKLTDSEDLLDDY